MRSRLYATVERLSVCLSVCLSVRHIIRPPHAAAVGLLLWARRPRDIDRFICLFIMTSYTVVQQVRTSTRSLRSSSAPLLHVPFRRTSFGKRSFSTAAPSVCNSLPVSVQNCDTLTLFKSRLEAHLFSSVYAS